MEIGGALIQRNKPYKNYQTKNVNGREMWQLEGVNVKETQTRCHVIDWS